MAKENIGEALSSKKRYCSFLRDWDQPRPHLRNSSSSQGSILPALGPQDSSSLHVLASLVPLFIPSCTSSYCVYYVCAKHWENNGEQKPSTTLVLTELTVYVERKPSIKGCKNNGKLCLGAGKESHTAGTRHPSSPSLNIILSDSSGFSHLSFAAWTVLCLLFVCFSIFPRPFMRFVFALLPSSVCQLTII